MGLNHSGGLGVVGSNPAAPTIQFRANRAELNAKGGLATA